MPLIHTEVLREFLCGQSPYEKADPALVDHSYAHTHVTPRMLEALFSIVRPTFVLEVGSMLGGSAIMMAETLKRLGMDASVVCVDPFTGDTNSWVNPDFRWALRLRNGVPGVLPGFLANVVDKRCDDVIIPINTTSIVGMRALSRAVKDGRISSAPQAIYLDSAHEEGETLLELRLAWQLLQPGGVLFGDDWVWPSVSDDVRALVREVRLDNPAMGRLYAALPNASKDSGVVLCAQNWFLCK